MIPPHHLPWIAGFPPLLHSAHSNQATSWRSSSPPQPTLKVLTHRDWHNSWFFKPREKNLNCELLINYFFYLRIVRTGLPWRFKGQVHKISNPGGMALKYQMLEVIDLKNPPFWGGRGHLVQWYLYPPILLPSNEQKFLVALIWDQCSQCEGRTAVLWQTKR